MAAITPGLGNGQLLRFRPRQPHLINPFFSAWPVATSSPLTYTYLQVTEDTTVAANHVFSAVNISTAQNDRTLIIGLLAEMDTTGLTTGVASLKVGTTFLTLANEQLIGSSAAGGGSQGIYVGIFYGLIDSTYGTSQDITADFGAYNTHDCIIQTSKVTGSTGVSVYQTAGNNGGAAVSIDNPTGGVIIGVAGNTGFNSASWTGLTQSSGGWTGVMYRSYAESSTAGTGQSISCTNGQVMTIASFQG